MNGFVQYVVTNSIAAAVLAVIVLVVTRFWRNPHAGHMLWLVVLVKLVFPPVFGIPLPARFLAKSSHLIPRDGVRLPERDPYTTPPAPTTRRVTVERSAATSVTDSAANGASAPSAPTVTAPRAAAHPALAVPHDDSVPTGNPKSDPATWTLAAWLVGSILVTLLVVWRAIRFGRAVREMLPASTPLQNAANDLAAQFKLRRAPQVRLTTAELTPLLWPGWRRPTIVLAARLATELSEVEVRTILAHELAHLYRRDHWVRWLEVLVTALYWWHPAVWLARCQLRRCEDSCCDACVLRVLPNAERTYAEAMFRTAKLASHVTRAAPMLASGFGKSENVKGRIEMMLKSNPPSRLNSTARVLLIIAAGTALAGSVALSQEDRPVSRRSQVPSAQIAPSPQAAPAQVEPKQAEAAPAGFAGSYGRSPSLAQSMDFSPDGSLLVGACSDGVVRVWDTRLGIPLHVLTGHAKPPGAVVITLDGASAISASYDGVIIVWDLKSGKIRARRNLEGPQDAFLLPAFTEEGKKLVTQGRNDESLYVWDVATGKIARIISLSPLGKPLSSGVTLSHDGKSIAVLTSPDFPNVRNTTATVWDLETGMLRYAHDFETPAFRLTLSPDSDLLAAANSEGIQIISVKDGSVVRTLPGRLRAPHAMIFSSDGNWLAVGGEGTQVREDSSFRMRIRISSEFYVWDIQTGRQLVSDGGIDGGSTWSFAFGANDRYLAQCDRRRVIILNPADRQHRMVIPLPPSEQGGYAPGDRTAELVHILVKEVAARHEQWLAVVRELKNIGKPAVRPLVNALDQTDDNATMRLLGFALRAVGEPEAIPGLIRAIPKTLQPAGSDLGLRVDDAELEAFAQEHDLDEGDRDGFGLGRPVREIFGALHKLTGANLGEDEINFVHLGGGRRQQELQRELYEHVANRWQRWWQENWRQYLDDPVLAEVDVEPAAAGESRDSAESQPWRLTLIAVDSETGAEIADPQLDVRLAGGQHLLPERDEDGEWTVEIPSRAPGYCQIDVMAGTYTPMRAIWSNRDGQPRDELPAAVTFHMSPGIEVGGRVVDEDGNPVAGATVQFSASSEQANRGRRIEWMFGDQSYETDEDGRWVCPFAPQEIDSGSISVSHPEYARDDTNYGLRGEQVDELRRLEYSFTLSKGFILKGRVVDWDGRPIEGVTLGVGELNTYRHKGPFATTQPDGRYEFPPLSRSHFGRDDDWPVTVTALKSGYAPLMQPVPNSGSKQLAENEARERVVDFVLREGETVTLLVTDSEGVPLQGAWVYPTSWRDTDALIALRHFGMPQRTDALGQWIWTWAPSDEVLYDVEASGYMRLRQEPVRPSDGIINIVLRRPQVISGQVVDAETREPIESFFIEKGWPGVAGHEETGGVYWDGMRTHGANGEYSKRITMPNEAYHYRVTAEGYEPAVSELVPVTEGPTDLDFELTRIEE